MTRPAIEDRADGVVERQEPQRGGVRREQDARDQDGQPDLDGRQQRAHDQLAAGLVALVESQESANTVATKTARTGGPEHQTDHEARRHPAPRPSLGLRRAGRGRRRGIVPPGARRSRPSASMTTNRAATRSRWNGERPSEYRAHRRAQRRPGTSGAARSIAPSSLRARWTSPARPAATGGAAASGAGRGNLSSWASRSSRTSVSLSRDTSSRTASRVSGSGSAGAALSPAPGGRRRRPPRQEHQQPDQNAEAGSRAAHGSSVPSRDRNRAERCAGRQGCPDPVPGDPPRSSYCNRARRARARPLVQDGPATAPAGQGAEQTFDARAVRLIEGCEHGPDQGAGRPRADPGPAGATARSSRRRARRRRNRRSPSGPGWRAAARSDELDRRATDARHPDRMAGLVDALPLADDERDRGEVDLRQAGIVAARRSPPHR